MPILYRQQVNLFLHGANSWNFFYPTLQGAQEVGLQRFDYTINLDAKLVSYRPEKAFGFHRQAQTLTSLDNIWTPKKVDYGKTGAYLGAPTLNNMFLTSFVTIDGIWIFGASTDKNDP